MAVLRPYPFGALVRRAFRELAQRRSLFDLPLERGFLGDPGLDLSVPHHGFPASSPFGPAAGPHSQFAQKIVLAWLAGGRIVEWKTVQVNDKLVIPRPCIDAQTVGFNVEWSQELKLEQSLEEYVKASMLLEVLAASGKLGLEPGFERFAFDLSVGYDLKGVQSERVRAFLSPPELRSPFVGQPHRAPDPSPISC